MAATGAGYWASFGCRVRRVGADSGQFDAHAGRHDRHARARPPETGWPAERRMAGHRGLRAGDGGDERLPVSAIDRIPMGVAVTLEFLGPCVVALAGSHHWREGLCAVVALVGEGLISFTPGGYFTGRLPVRAGLGRVLRPVHALRRPGRQDGRRARRARPVGHGRGAGHFAGIHRSRPACVGRPVGRHRRLGGAGSRDSLHDGHVVRAYHVGARGRHACSPSTPP